MLKVWHDIYILRIGRRKLKSCVKARIKTKKNCQAYDWLYTVSRISVETFCMLG